MSSVEFFALFFLVSGYIIAVLDEDDDFNLQVL